MTASSSPRTTAFSWDLKKATVRRRYSRLIWKALVPRPVHLTTAEHRRRWSRRFYMEDREIRAALERHWAASDANDFEAEHQIYREDAVLEYPQSGERIRGRRKIQESRTVQPNKKRFSVRRIIDRKSTRLNSIT